MRQDAADYARDHKKEGGMCAFSVCTGSPYEEAPTGWGTGRYGGRHLCKKHYRQVVDELTESLFENGRAPWEDE